VFFEKGKLAADGDLEENIARFAWETSSNGHKAATPPS
jgi:hypothetical protein